MSRQFFSGNSIEQSIMAAARHYGVEPEKIAYTTRDKKHGFLNVRRRVVIEVDPENPQLTEEDLARPAEAESSAPPASKPKMMDAAVEVTLEERDDLAGPEPELHPAGEEDIEDEGYEADDAEERSSSDVADTDEADEDRDSEESRGDVRQGRPGSGKKPRDRGDDRRPWQSRKQDRTDDDNANVRTYSGVKLDWKQAVELEGVSRALAAFEFAVEQTLDVMDLEIEYTIVEGDTFKIEFSGEDAELLTEDDGRVLKAFEHVLPRIVRGLVGETLNCKVDCEGFRAEHEDQLVELAQEAADEVRQSGDSKILSQMNPSDRRIIHLALVNDPDVETVSQGRGYMKKVRIQLLDEN